MNGAAMNCQKDLGLRPHHRNSSSLHNPGYHLQINPQQNSLPQNSKTLNYQSLSTNYPVDAYNSNLRHNEHILDSRHSIQEIEGLRPQRPRVVDRRNEPLDLPVPRFVIDENSVTHVQKDSLIEGSKGLDLDTRIGMLLKSKALAGMHPIFSDLNDSEESGSDIDDPLISKPRYKSRKIRKRSLSIERDSDLPFHESFDDPERPLSRPPSPFLSRATYLFWFNKAIEIKQQAKAQEQALLEQATKRLTQDTGTSQSIKTNHSHTSQKMPIPKTLMDELSKELKEVIKQEFIREVIELTAFKALDDWWDKQYLNEKIPSPDSLKTCNMKSENCQDSLIYNKESQGSTSPKMPYPCEVDLREGIVRDTESSLKFTREDDMMFENKTSRTSCEVNLNHACSVPKAKDILMNEITQEDEYSLHDESRAEDVKKECERNHQAVSNGLAKLDNEFATKKLNESLISNICVSGTLSKVCERSQDNSLDGKTIEKLAIVKDILDLICDNVNKIILQRDIPCRELKETLPYKNCNNLSASTDS